MMIHRAGLRAAFFVVVLTACSTEHDPSPETSVHYLDAEALYMSLTSEPHKTWLAPPPLTGRIQQLPTPLGTLPWQLHLKARSEQETLLVEVTQVVPCQDNATPLCIADYAASLVRGQRVFLQCQQGVASPQATLSACLLGSERLPASD